MTGVFAASATGRVKVKNSRHGVENPNARFRKENSVDDVVNSPVVADPLRLLDICATSDGAAAMIVSSMDYARSALGSTDGVVLLESLLVAASNGALAASA
jgi:acetyl-CoA acetyltransferase